MWIQRILLMAGPAGAGKTTALRVIANELGVDLVEWDESIEERSLGGGFGAYSIRHRDSSTDPSSYRARIAYIQTFRLSLSKCLHTNLHVYQRRLTLQLDCEAETFETPGSLAHFHSQHIPSTDQRGLPRGLAVLLQVVFQPWLSTGHHTQWSWIEWTCRRELDG